MNEARLLLKSRFFYTIGRSSGKGRSGKEETGIYKGFKYEETGVEGAEFEIYAKDTIYSPDGAKDEAGNPVVRYEKDDLVAKLTTDENGTAVINNLPLGTYYLKEVVAGENFVLNTEQKEFTLTAEDDTQAVVYEGVTYKNERQKVFVFRTLKFTGFRHFCQNYHQ